MALPPNSHCFILELPTEIHQMITEYLSDNDIAHYLRSSKVIANSINDSVWYARFRRDFDFDFDLSRKAHGEKTEEKIVTALKYKTRRNVCNTWVSFNRNGWPKMQYGAALQVLELVLESNAKIIINEEGQTIVSGRNLDFLREYVGGNMPNPEISPRKIRHLQINGTLIGPQGQKSGTDILDHLFSNSTPPPSPSSTIRTRSSRRNSRIQTDVFEFPVLPYLQLTLTHLMLDPKACYGKDDVLARSQAEVYKCYSTEPIFQGPNKQYINVNWLLHVASFFKLHLKRQSEGIFYNNYKELADEDKPAGWVGKIEQGTTKLGNNWLGAYTYLHREEIGIVRGSRVAGHEVFIDKVTDPAAPFQEQELRLEFNISQEDFPRVFEDILHAKPAGPHFTGVGTTPRVPNTKYFTSETEDWEWTGCTHSLPPQQGIPGWQRFSMIKCKLDDNDVPDLGEIWAYEGVVLPGGNIILGRWWCPVGDPIEDGQSFCGPFIFWQTHSNKYDEDEAENDVQTED